jgi:hypothetical protein
MGEQSPVAANHDEMKHAVPSIEQGMQGANPRGRDGSGLKFSKLRVRMGRDPQRELD